MRISDWSSDVCSSDLPAAGATRYSARWSKAPMSSTRSNRSRRQAKAFTKTSPSRKSSSRKRRSLNKIRLPGVVWIASDIHLGPHTHKTRQAFFRFLEAASGDAAALILCGDIFDAWLGADLALPDRLE